MILISPSFPCVLATMHLPSTWAQKCTYIIRCHCLYYFDKPLFVREWEIGKQVPSFSGTLWGIFSDVHCEDLVELQGLEMTIPTACRTVVPWTISPSPLLPLTSSHLSITVQPGTVSWRFPWVAFFSDKLSFCRSTSLSRTWWSALWTHLSDRSRKSCWLFSMFRFLLVSTECYF